MKNKKMKVVYGKVRDSKLYYTVEINETYDPERDIYDILNVQANDTETKIASVYKATVDYLEKEIKKNPYLKNKLDDVNYAWNIISDPRIRTPYNEAREKSIYKREPKAIDFKVKIEQVYDSNNDYYEFLNASPSDTDIMKKCKDALTKIDKQISKNDSSTITDTNENEENISKKTTNKFIPINILENLQNQIFDMRDTLKDERLKDAYDNARNEYNRIHGKKSSKTRVVKTESGINSEKVKKAAFGVLAALTVGAVVVTIIHILKNKNDKDEIEDAIEDEIKYNNRAFIEHAIEDTELDTGEVIEPEPEIDINVFTDPTNEDQIHARATLMYNGLVASNINNITIEELEDQIRFVNGVYPTFTDAEAYEILNETLNTWAIYGGNLGQGASFAGGVVSENGVHQTVSPIGMLPVTSEHYDFMVEASTLWTNVLTAQDIDAKYYAAIEYLKQATELKQALLVDSTNTRLGFMELDPKEGFIYGLMFHTAYPHIVSALGPNYVITIQDNNGNDVYFGIQETWSFYNPQCNENDDEMNPWYHLANELLQGSLILGSDSDSGLYLRNN